MRGEVDKPIAFFDSGVGGISVLATAVKMLPGESFVYYGDTAHAPYGSRSVAEVRELSARAAGELYGRGCKALVVACNTATSAGIDFLRDVMPIPVIGMEPALKPALECKESGKVLVMATPLTLKEEKFRNLCCRCDADGKVIVLPCPGIVELVESGQYNGPAVDRMLLELLKEVDIESLTTVVLGCTHYFFIREAMSGLLRTGVNFVDGNMGTVKQLNRVLSDRGLLRESNKVDCKVEFMSTGDEKAVHVFERLYRLALNLV